MKFVIWGAGLLGSRIRIFLGDRALAYIDSNSTCQGTKRDGLDVLSFQEYLEQRDYKFQGAWIIISPRDFVVEMKRELEQKGIQNYFVLTEAPERFFDYPLDGICDKIMHRYHKAEEIPLYGLDCFHVVLYEKLSEAGYHPVIWIPAEKWEENGSRIAELSHWNIRCRNDKMPVLDDVELLSGLQNRYANSDLAKFHNMYKGRRCFVVATGPSLRMEDLETLRKNGELCISMNGIFHAFEKVKWRPDFYIMVGANKALYCDIMDQMDVRFKLIGDANMDFWEVPHPENIYRFHDISGKLYDIEHSFSEDITDGIYGNSTVTNVCIQLGVYLGCKEIYLLGTDFSDRTGKGVASSHFTKDYLASEGTETCYTDQLIENIMLRGYQATRCYFDTHPDIKLYNATRGGYLELFERRNFDELFS